MPLSPHYGVRVRHHSTRWLKHHWRDFTLGGMIILAVYGLLYFLER